MNEDDRALIARFSADALTPFSEEGLADDIRAQSFVPPALPTQIAGLATLRRYDNLAPLIILLQDALSKFEFGKHSLEEWKEKYVFPRRSSLRRFRREQFGPGSSNAIDSDLIVNQSPEHVARWVTRDIIGALAADGRDPYPIMVLAGGTGAGKSSLNKYVTTVHFEDFVTSRIVTSRIEYRKFYAHLERQDTFSGDLASDIEAEIRRKAQKYLICCCVRDVLHSSFTRQQEQADGHTRMVPSSEISPLGVDLREGPILEAFNDFVRHGYKDKCGADPSSLVPLILRAYERFQAAQTAKRGDWFNRAIAESVTSDDFLAMELYLYFCVSRGVKFYLIFDGFDFIQAADFLHKTTHSLVLETLARWIIQDAGKLHLPRSRETVKPMVQVTMRSSTVECFWKEQNQAYGVCDPITFYVAPPELKDIYDSVASRIVRRYPEYASTQDGQAVDLFAKVQRGLSAATGLSTVRVSALFLNNTRHRVNYVRNVLEAALRDALAGISNVAALRASDLAGLLWPAVDQITSHKSYRLIEVLLQSKSDRFANFVRVEHIQRWLTRDERRRKDMFIAERILKDNNIKSGYVGNLFNYHIPYEDYRDLEFFLEKVRIIELLKPRAGMSKRQLVGQFAARGWRPSAYFDITLAILIREALIEGVFAEPEGQYRVTKLGHLVATRMVGQVQYIENVYFGCLLPGALVRDSIDVTRSRDRRLDWVAAAIFHTWIMLRFIKTAEQTAEARGTAFAFERIRGMAAPAIEAIVVQARTRPLGGDLSKRVLAYMRRIDERLAPQPLPALRSMIVAGVALSSCLLMFPKPTHAQVTCQLFVGERTVVVQSSQPVVGSGRLCIEGRCREVQLSHGVGVWAGEVQPGQVASFVPKGGSAGCAAASQEEAAWYQDALPAIVTGLFTLVAALAGAFLIEAFRAWRDRMQRSLEWVESYRRKLWNWRNDSHADVSSPPIPHVDLRTYRALRAAQTKVESLTHLPTNPDHRARADAVSAALIVLDESVGLASTRASGNRC